MMEVKQFFSFFLNQLIVSHESALNKSFLKRENKHRKPLE
jgi:hypothetical protein